MADSARRAGGSASPQHCKVRGFPVEGVRRDVPAGSFVFTRGEWADCLYLIIEGSVSVMIESEAGDETVLTHLFAGDIFGELCLSPDIDRRTATIVTREDCALLRVPYRKFLAAASENPELWIRIVRQLSDQLIRSSARVQLLSRCNATQRIASLLRDLAASPTAEHRGKHSVLTITRQELAGMAGCSREVVSRELQKLRRAGLIDTQGRKLLITGLVD